MLKKVFNLNKSEKLFPVVLTISLLACVSVLVVIYLLFFKTQEEELIQTTENLRNTSLDFILNEKHQLNDYESLLFANNTMVYNTCSKEILPVPTPHFSWTRDWLYLAIFDSMYSEKTNTENYKKQSQVLIDSLYEKYSTGTDGGLSLYALAGYENSYCLPYFILKNLEKDNQFQITYNLSQKLCYDFYSEEHSELSCTRGERCVNEEQFYLELKNVFSENEKEQYPESSENFHVHTKMMIDNYIVAYGKNWEKLLQYANGELLQAIKYMKSEIEESKQLGPESASPCIYNANFYSDLFKAMAIKKISLTDLNLIDQHTNLEEELLNLCNPYYLSLYGIIDAEKPLASKIELYYLYKFPVFHEEFLDNLIEEEISNKMFEVRYNGELFYFLENERNETSQGCFDIKFQLRDNIKNSLYLLMYSIYGS